MNMSHRQLSSLSCGMLVLICVLAYADRRRRLRQEYLAKMSSRLRDQERELCCKDAMINQLSLQVKSEGRQRAEERKGRTEAERRLREQKQEREQTDGYNFTAIGTISTPFRDRRGTPRQGSITPLSRGKVIFDASIVGYPALIGLSDFSHIWLLFIFHDNTNATVNGVAADRPGESRDAHNEVAPAERGTGPEQESIANGGGPAKAIGQEGPGRWGGGPREYQSPGHKLRQTFLTKVCPPRLGKKIGVLGTRSPHRPNPLGLTMVKSLRALINGLISGYESLTLSPSDVRDVKIRLLGRPSIIVRHMCQLEAVDLKTNSVSVSGVDLVDGTPIVDVKPVIPHDVPQEIKFPDWVKDDRYLRRVVFTEDACRDLERCVGDLARRSKSRFYADPESFKAAATEVLVQDVRSVHRGRGLASDELYECFFDGVVMHFVTTEDEMRIMSAE